jgi:CBS domain-containing membrane protein
VDVRERVRIAVGAFVGILLTAAIGRWLAGAPLSCAWLLAPLGASAVLIFAAPASPLAQPWSVVGGNVLSAAIGMACAASIPSALLAAAFGVALAISAMLMLRCLHPPGGAMALLAVLSHSGAGHFPLDVALTDSLLLVGAGLIFNPLSGKRYPHVQLAPAEATAVAGTRILSTDLDTVLERYNQVLDVSRDDLEALLLATELEGHRRRIGNVRCHDVMSRDPASAEFGSTLQEAWDLMKTRRIKALPVVDRARRVVGILTMADILRAAGLERQGEFAARLRKFLQSDGLTHSEKPEVVGQIMTRDALVVRQDNYLMDLLPIFNETGHHHLPVVDGDRHLVGVLTQSDFVRALQRGNFLTARP